MKCIPGGFIILFVLLHFDTISQSCSGNLGENIFTNGDFGSGTANILLPDPRIAPGYIYSLNNPPEDGFYVITNNTGAWPGLFPTWLAIKDNSPDPNGYMMVVNAGFLPGIFYVQNITGLCENTLYEFSADVINLIKNPVLDHILPNISFLLNDQVKYNTGAIPQSERWNTAGFTFTTGPGQFSLKLSLQNNAPGGNGNDLAIDNITFRACGPKALILPDAVANICQDGNPITLKATIQGNQYSKPAIQWQISPDGMNNWTDLGQDSTLLHSNLNAGSYYYRYLVAGSPQNLVNSKCRIISNIKTIIVHPKFYDYTDTICEGVPYNFGNTPLTSTGIYKDSLKSILGCDSIITLRLTVLPDHHIAATHMVSNPSCQKIPDGTISITSISNGYAPYTITLNTDLLPVNNGFAGLASGSHTLNIKDRYGCALTDRIQLIEPPPYLVDLGDDLHILLGQEILLHATSTLTTMSGQFWFDGQVICDLSCDGDHYLPLTTASLKWVAKSDRGCLASDSISIIVENVVKNFVPNIFTPNGDGINDYFFPMTSQNIVKAIKSFIIYDRYGGMVYGGYNLFAQDISQGWDGTRLGKPADQGVYVYKAEILLINDELVTLAGDILLIR